MSSLPVCLGLDLGTGNSSIAFVVDSPRVRDSKVIPVEPVLVPKDEHGDRVKRLPSILAARNNDDPDGRPWFGWEFLNNFFGSRKKAALLRHGRDFFVSVKSDLGTYRVYPYSKIADCTTPAQVASKIIARLLGAAEEALPGIDPRQSRVAITVPASAGALAREDTLEAARLAGIDRERVQLMDEPVAALIDLLNASNAPLVLEPDTPTNILVFDYGAGTCDLSLVTVRQDSSKATGLSVVNRAISPYRRLGGDDVDRAVMQQVVWPQLIASYGLPEVENLPLPLRREVEDTFTGTVARRLKESLCAKAAALSREDPEFWMIFVDTLEVTVPLLRDFKIAGATKQPKRHFNLDGQQFLEVMRPFLEKLPAGTGDKAESRSLIAPINETLEKGGLSPLDLHVLVLHGGSCHNPFVKSLMEETFQEAGSLFARTKIVTTPDLDASVAKGAALACYWEHVRHEAIVAPILPEELGIVARDHKPVRLVAGGAPLPFPQDSGIHEVEEEFYVARGGQRHLLVPFYARDPERVAGSVVVPLPEDVRQGALVRVKLRVDEDKVLHWWFSVDAGEFLAAPTVNNPWTSRLPSPELGRLDSFRRQMLDATRERGAVPIEMLRQEPVLLSRAGLGEEALLAIDDYVAACGEDAEIMNAKGLVCGEHDRPVEERLAHAAAVRLEPDNAIYRGNYGYVLASFGEWQRARVQLRRALKLDASLPYVWERLGDVYGELDEPERADRAYRRAIRLSRLQTGTPSTALMAWMRLARLYREVGEDERADDATASAEKLLRDARYGGDTRNLIASKDSGVFSLEE